MNTTHKTTPSDEGKQMLETLRQAIGKAFERKKRLGQYAVIWKDGRPVMRGEDALYADEKRPSDDQDNRNKIPRSGRP